MVNFFDEKAHRYNEKFGNCFDEYLFEHKESLGSLDKNQLAFLENARELCSCVCELYNFSRVEIEACVKEGVAAPDGVVSQMFNSFAIADTFFEK